jgi:hypothetical protein
LNKGISPQAPEISHFAQKYAPKCDPELIFLVAANFIKKPNSKTLRKQTRSLAGPSVLSNLICGIKDIVKPVTKHSNRHSTYEIPLLDTSSQSSSSASLKKRSLTPDLVADRSDGKMSSIFPSSVSSPNLAKQDSGSSSSSSRPPNDLITFSEDYSRIVEERERKMEERRMSGSRGSSGSSSANGETRTPKSKKRTLVQLPNAPNREIKPSTILRLEDRDLVVIDKQDIKEAVNNESQVIIVDPPALAATPAENEHVDLGDILGGHWPDLAGTAAGLLNADKKSGSVSSAGNGWKTVERNKSANIASHFSNSKPRRSDGFESNGYDKSSHRKSEYMFIHFGNIQRDFMFAVLLSGISPHA